MGWSLTGGPLSYRSWDLFIWRSAVESCQGSQKGDGDRRCTCPFFTYCGKNNNNIPPPRIFKWYYLLNWKNTLHHGIMLRSTLKSEPMKLFPNCCWSWASMVRFKCHPSTWPSLFVDNNNLIISFLILHFIFTVFLFLLPLLGITWHNKLGTVVL